MQRILDQLYGLWLKDIDYYFDTPQKRNYNIEKKEIKKYKCPMYIGSKGRKRTVNMNGRGFYFDFQLKENPPQGNLQFYSPQPTFLLPFNNKWYPIFYLLCGNITSLSDLKKISGKRCTEIGKNISSSVIKVASTRIFTKPEQCVVEMIVNSIDSYSVQKGLPKVGKFGMGFFSILYFLIDHPLRYLAIVTIENKKAVLLKIRYRKNLKNLHFNLNYITTDSESGTYIHMETEKDPFTSEQTDLFNQFIYYTKFVKDASIKVYSSDKSFDVNLSKSPDLIVSIINRNRICFEDYGTGISIENVLSSLLVPSTSTKTMKISDEVIEYKNESAIDVGVYGKFYIVCNQIVIVKIDLKLPANIIMTVPSTVRLPVSRDDVIFDEKNAFESLHILLENSIQNNSIIELEYSIDAYVNYTSNYKNKEIFNRFKKQMYDILKKRGIITVDNSNYEFISSLIKGRIIKSVKNDAMSIESLIDSLNLTYREDIFSNKRVVFVKEDMYITNAGTYKYLFVGPVKSGWKEEAIINFQEERLYMVSSIESKESTQIENILSEFEKSFSNSEIVMIRKLMSVFLSLQDRVNIIDKMSSMRELVYGVYFISKIDRSFIAEYIDMLSNYFSNISINYSYGMSKIDFGHNTNFSLDETSDMNYSKSLFDKMSIGIDSVDKEKIKEYMINRFLLLSDTNQLSYFNFTTGILNYFFNTILKRIKVYKSLSIFEIIFVCRTKYLGYYDEQTVKMIYNLYIKDIEDYRLTSVPYWKINTILNYACNALILSKKKLVIKDEIFDTRFESQFTFKQLITYVFSNSDVDKIKPSLIKNESKNEKLQLLEISVDAGTNKPFLQATLTELLQNSLDAYRLEKRDRKVVEIDVVKIDKKLMVTVTDFVGMTSSNIIALSIPFYSNKVSSSVVTGEMGTGFFNIYRESDLVIVHTIKNNRAVVMKDRPIRDKHGNIVDLEKNIEYYEDIQSNTTNISFFIDYTPTVISDIYYYSTNVLSYMDIDLMFNKEKITSEKNLIYTEDSLSFYITKNPIISFIFTKGVPFSPLTDYLKKNKDLFDMPNEIIYELSSKVIIDIGHDFYLPTQSRTNLQISSENIKKLNAFFYRAVFYISIYNFSDILNSITYALDYRLTRNNYLNNMGDNELVTVLFNLNNFHKIHTKKTILLYTKLNGLNNMAHIIKDVYQIIGKEPIYKHVKEIKNYFDKLEKQCKDSPEIFKRYKQIITKWLSTKNVTADKEPLNKDQESDTEEIELKYDIYTISASDFKEQIELKNKNVLRDIKLVFSTFVDLFLKHSNEHPSVIEISLKKIKSYNIAQYLNNKIEINKKYLDANHFLNFIRNIDNYILNIGNLRNDPFYDKWFSNSTPASIIPHELEHSRRNSTHDKGQHDSIIYKGQTYSFDEIATKLVKDKNISLEWLQLIKRELKK